MRHIEIDADLAALGQKKKNIRPAPLLAAAEAPEAALPTRSSAEDQFFKGLVAGPDFLLVDDGIRLRMTAIESYRLLPDGVRLWNSAGREFSLRCHNAAEVAALGQALDAQMTTICLRS